MADPHHVEELDSFDRLTVGLYRLGLFTSAGGVVAVAVQRGLHTSDAVGRVVVLLGVALIVANLHLYDRKIRWVESASGWLGATLLYASAVIDGPVSGWLADGALGLLFVVLSATALKERFCFKLPIVVAVPPLLAASLVPLRFGLDVPAAGLLMLAACVLVVLAVAKAIMPLHYDIGDKSRYQV